MFQLDAKEIKKPGNQPGLFPSVARPARCTGRVHARGHRTEPTPARQAGRPTTTSNRRVWGIAVAGIGARASKLPLPVERAATGGFKKSLQPPNSSDRRLLQQNLPLPDSRAATKLGRFNWANLPSGNITETVSGTNEARDSSLSAGDPYLR